MRRADPAGVASITKGLEAVFITLPTGERVQAERRRDLPNHSDVFECRTEDGPRFWRVEEQGDWLVPVDVTETVAADLERNLRQAQATTKATAEADRIRLTAAENSTPVQQQAMHRDIAEEPADAVVRRHRVRTPLQKLHGSRRLTGRQFSAGQALREDDLLSMMIRQPADLDSPRGSYGDGGGACFETAAIDAANRIARVRRACDAVSPLLWPVVQAVVIQEQTITELAGSERGRDTRPYMLALKGGLDVVGDCYGLPTEFTPATVRLNGATAQMEVMEEANGSWRTRSLNGRPWMFEAKTVNEVFSAARVELRARVAAILGPGEHPDARVGAALKADRIAAQGQAVARHQVNAERELNRLHDIVVERQRVLKVCA